jgi:ankyrin repeat protein
MAFDKQVQKVVAAAMAGNVKAVKKYLDGGGDPDVVDFFGFSILQRAVGASQVPVVELLLDRGATLTEKAIERAKEKDHPEMLAFLASRGVSVKHVPFEELPQDEKDTRLFKAVRGAGFDALAGIVETMVSQGASLGARQGGRTPLMVLAHECSLFTAAAETMIRLGADVGATDDEGRTALHLAAAQGAGVELARALLDAGLNVDVRDAAGRTPLHAAAESTYHSSQKMVELLVDRGAQIDAVDASGNKPQDLASGDVRTWLLAQTAEPLAPLDAELLRAVTAGFLDDVKALLERGANPCAVDLGSTKYGSSRLSGVSALHAAMTRDVPIEVALAVLDAPTLDPNVRDVEGSTPLHHAVRRRVAPDRRTLVERLVARGADPTVRDARGDTVVCPLISFHALDDELELLEYFEARGVDLSNAQEGFTLVDEMYQRIERFSQVRDKKGFTRVFRFLVDRGVKTRDPDMQKWADQWLAELEAKHLAPPKRRTKKT